MKLLTHGSAILTCAFAALRSVGSGRGPATILVGQSKPGGDARPANVKYDGHQRTSVDVAARDGTKLAVDLFQPTSKGVLATEKRPVVWMHTPPR